MSTSSVTQNPITPPPARSYVGHQILGHGGFSTVYSAIERDSGCRCAVKLYDCDEESRVEGYREIRNLRMLTQAPHVVQYFDYCNPTTSHGPAIVEELVENGNLLRHYHHFTLRDIITTAKQTLEALAYFHERNLIYCDLKFENTLWKTDKYIKLADFGSMRYISDEPTERLVTVFNRPLEVCLGGPYDTSLDMFSFGTFVFRLITKNGPFEIAGYDDRSPYFHRYMVQLLYKQCGYPSKEQLAPLRLTDEFFTFRKNGTPQPKHPIPMVFTPWKTMLQKGCRERGFDKTTSLYFIHLIGLCLKNKAQRRVTAANALKHPLFCRELSFSVVSNFLHFPKLNLTLYKKDTQGTPLLQVKLADEAALRCLHLSGYSFVECMLKVNNGPITYYEKEITIKRHSNLSITIDENYTIHVAILKGAGQQLPVHTTVSIQESKKRDVV